MVFQPQIASISVEEFREIVARPENGDRLFELINGEMIEKMPGRTRTSEVALAFPMFVGPYCRENGLPCHVSGADGTYRIGKDVVAPDFAYKRTATSTDYPDPVAPLWVVEVISPTDEAGNIRNKRHIYQQAGILLWEVYLDTREVDVYTPGEPPATFQLGDTLTVGDILPGFTLAVKDIFGG